MFSFIRKMSLRARLFALTAFAVTALLIAVLSAYRTARTSQFYAERQAAAGVAVAVRELQREARDFSVSGAAGNFGKDKKMPPHVREAFEKYQDSLTRATAIALRPGEDVSGGFCTADGETKGAIFNQNFSQNEMPFVQNLCRQKGENNVRRYDFENSTLFASTAEFDGGESGAVNGAFAVQSVEKSNPFADRFNFLTQLFLLVSVVGLAIFSFLTLRGWGGGMRKIEAGLNEISEDLSSRIDAPQISELNKISREINRLAENLETNLERQKKLERDLLQNEKLAALGRMASGAAHEIRNPLAAMKLKIQLAERNKFDTEKLAKTFAVLSEEIERLDNIVKKLLDASRPAKLYLSRIDLVGLIKRRLAMTAEKAAAQKVKIKFEAGDGNLEIEADGEKLTQVFDNLLNNALEAMPDGGSLRVKISLENEKIIIEIEDTGIGISDADRARLFELFYTTKDGGTGLGLAISREIIEAHGGRLYFSERETGAAFIVELPLNKHEKNLV